jgi:type II secretory pathway component PulF
MNAPTARSPFVVAVIAVVVHGLLGLVSLYGMLSLVPGYKRRFAEYQMALPYVTVAVVEISDWFVTYWYVVVISTLPLIALDGAIVFWCWTRKGTRILGILWIILWIVLWMLFAAFVAFGLWLAYVKLLEALSR